MKLREVISPADRKALYNSALDMEAKTFTPKIREKRKRRIQIEDNSHKR